MRFEDTMKTTRSFATVVTVATLMIGTTQIAAAGEQYAFPSPNGAQLASTPTPVFVVPGQTTLGVGNASAGATLAYGHTTFANHEPPPIPPPGFAFATQTPYASRLMSHALMVAPYANYAADYSRLFAPNYAVSAWTDRVFGIMTGGYGAVDGWTAAAYGLPRVAGPRRRSESAPDLSIMPKLRNHPELQESPAFDRRAD
jgi:hypothetical protein